MDNIAAWVAESASEIPIAQAGVILGKQLTHIGDRLDEN